MPGVRSRRTVPDIWPGFVDAISALLIIVIFLLMVFTLSQYFLGEILSGRNEALQRLNRQIAELGEMLALERSSNDELRRDLSQMSAELQSSVAAREDMAATISSLAGERDALEAARERLTARVDELLAEREETQKAAEADREKITSQLAMMESLRRDIEALRKVRAELEARVGTLDQSLTAARDRTKELEAKLSTQEERTALAQKEIEERKVRLSELGSTLEQTRESLSEEKKLSSEAQNQVTLLNRQLDAVRRELARLNAALEASEAKAKEQRVQIANLGQRLNAALASKVEELARYRSEFFGRLREVLGSRQDIRIVGDRFVFQSEVLFETASAELQPGGQTQIRQLADTLKEIAAKIPNDLDWVLRVDGHTDRRPISTPQFPSNWELSTARAIAVVKYLVQLGLPPERFVAAGFGEYQPLDSGNDEIALRRNRRIEFKLTER